MIKQFFLTSALLLSLSFTAKAELTIEIVGGAANQIPIAVLPFDTNPASASDKSSISNVINADLKRSGLFRTMLIGLVCKRKR